MPKLMNIGIQIGIVTTSHNEIVNIAFISSIDDLNVGKLRKQGYIDAIKGNPVVKYDPITLTLNSNQEAQSQIAIFLKNNKHIDGVISPSSTKYILRSQIKISLSCPVYDDIKSYPIVVTLSFLGFWLFSFEVYALLPHQIVAEHAPLMR